MPRSTPAPIEISATIAAPASAIPRRERWLAALLLLAALALRCFYIFRFRYDSDEPQHLHTTWGWTQGLVQYRDFFDNHTPLFHLLFSPLVAALGERADILTCMRFAMVPLWLVCLWAVWRIGGELYSRRAGLWSAVVISLWPWWFFPALEYRTDNLWAPLWLCALAVFVTGAPSWKRHFWGGFLLGLCCAVSMKTTLILAAGAMAAVLAPVLAGKRPNGAFLQEPLKAALAIAAGLVIVPALLCGSFALAGCWHEFYYGVIGHNLFHSVDARAQTLAHRLYFPVALPFLLYGAARIGRGESREGGHPTPVAIRRAGLFLFAGIYYTALYTFWALITRQDFLPFYPVAAIVAVPWIVRGADRLGSSKTPWAPCLLAAMGLVEIGLILGGRPPWIDGTRAEREILREVLELTRPGEYVMDQKGESVFRRRAFHYVLEPLTCGRIRWQMLEDTIPQDVVAKGVNVVVNRSQAYPRKTLRFLSDNYLRVGEVRVAGRVLSAGPAAPHEVIRFSVAIPSTYVLWAYGLPVKGLLDGQPYDGGGLSLAPGMHTFEPEAAYPCLALFWERAAKAGYHPVISAPSWQHDRT